jgi:hypothetical protein
MRYAFEGCGTRGNPTRIEAFIMASRSRRAALILCSCSGYSADTTSHRSRMRSVLLKASSATACIPQSVVSHREFPWSVPQAYTNLIRPALNPQRSEAKHHISSLRRSLPLRCHSSWMALFRSAAQSQIVGGSAYSNKVPQARHV